MSRNSVDYEKAPKDVQFVDSRPDVGCEGP